MLLKLLSGVAFGYGVLTAEVQINSARGTNRVWVQVVFQAAFSCQDCTAAQACVDLFHSSATHIGFRRTFAVVEMKFENSEGSQPIGPQSYVTAAKRHKNQSPLFFHGCEAGQAAVMLMQHRCDSPQKLHIVDPFHNGQYAGRTVADDVFPLSLRSASALVWSK